LVLVERRQLHPPTLAEVEATQYLTQLPQLAVAVVVRINQGLAVSLVVLVVVLVVRLLEEQVFLGRVLQVA
jgi:hypothetical protein